jgi:hypothetical protein
MSFPRPTLASQAFLTIELLESASRLVPIGPVGSLNGVFLDLVAQNPLVKTQCLSGPGLHIIVLQRLYNHLRSMWANIAGRSHPLPEGRRAAEAHEGTRQVAAAGAFHESGHRIFHDVLQFPYVSREVVAHQALVELPAVSVQLAMIGLSVFI